MAMRPKVYSLAPADLDADGVCESQTPAGGGVQSLTINGNLASGGVATPDIPRRIGITSVGDDSGRTFTITGTDRYGQDITEAVTGANAGLATSRLDFATVTAVTTDDDTADAVTVGTTGVVSSPWFVPDRFADNYAVGFGVIVSGTINYDVEVTYDDVLDGDVTPSSLFEIFNHADVVNETTNQQGSITAPVGAMRLTVNSLTAPATAEITILTSG